MTKTVTQQQTSVCVGIDQTALAVADDIVRQMMDRGALLAVRDNDGELVPMDLGRQSRLKAGWQTAIAAALSSPVIGDETHAEALRIAERHLIKMGWKFAPAQVGQTAKDILTAMTTSDNSKGRVE